MTHHLDRRHPNLCGHLWDDHYCLLGGGTHYDDHLCECGQTSHQDYWDQEKQAARGREAIEKSAAHRAAFLAEHPLHNVGPIEFYEWPDGILVQVDWGEDFLRVTDIDNLITYLQAQKARLTP